MNKTYLEKLLTQMKAEHWDTYPVEVQMAYLKQALISLIERALKDQL